MTINNMERRRCSLRRVAPKTSFLFSCQILCSKLDYTPPPSAGEGRGKEWTLHPTLELAAINRPSAPFLPLPVAYGLPCSKECLPSNDGAERKPFSVELLN